MDLWRIAVRALAAYIYLMVMTRASGKRVVHEATAFDFVIALIVGDMIDDALWAEVSMATFAAGVGSLFVCDAVAKVSSFHSERVFLLLQGTPRVAVRDGFDDGHEMRKEQMNEGDIAHLLRLHGIDDRENVHLGIVERDHQLSVIRDPAAEPAQKKLADRVKEMLR
jgi:uncharacterized membrane protein YcaP (DUF421 family)